MALFGEKYSSDVRVVTISEFSVELCGGTHVERTGDIGLFRLVSESGIAAGVRRIEAQTGTGAIASIRAESDQLGTAAGTLKTQPDRLVESIEKLQDERRQLERKLKALETKLAQQAAGALLDSAVEIDGVKVLAAEFDGDLREQADRLRDQLGTSVVVLVAKRGERVQILVAASKDIAGKRVHAGKLVRPLAGLVGGGGGGRPDMAQAGGKDASGIPAVLEQTPKLVAEMLGA
jgi:alanyl-tRNA synthetase